MKRTSEEQVVQKFPHRCPYCDQIVSYDKFNMKTGENEIECPSCKKKYIKVVLDDSPPPLPAPRLRQAGSPPPLAFAEAPALRKASGGGASRRQTSRGREKNQGK